VIFKKGREGSRQKKSRPARYHSRGFGAYAEESAAGGVFWGVTARAGKNSFKKKGEATGLGERKKITKKKKKKKTGRMKTKLSYALTCGECGILDSK